MKLPRASILGLMVVIAVVAMAFAALRTASDLWFSALYTSTTVLLLVAVIAARFLRGGQKAFWFGFAVFGWGFFLLGLGPWTNPMSDMSQVEGGSFNPNLLTSKAIRFLVARLRKGTNDLEEIDKITANTIGIAHLLITLALAISGGIVAVLMSRYRRRLTRANPVVISLSVLALISASASLSYFDQPGLPPLDDSSEAGRYSEYLDAMHEPPLAKLSRQGRDAIVYRLLWVPSFHHPVCVRIDRKGDRAKLRAVVLDGMGGYEMGQVAIEKKLTLDGDRWRRLEQHLADSKFWSMPSKLEDDEGSDGDQLMIEGVEGGRYHVVDRWEPDPAYAELCRYMLVLTGLKVQDAWEGYHSQGSSP